MRTADSARLFMGVFERMLPKKGGKVAGGFEMNETMMGMLGGFTLLRLSGMMGMMGVKMTKEVLLALNGQLNGIRKPMT